jgi:predicted dehydrogenase
VRIGLVGLGSGGASSYHARSFAMIFNGRPQAVPADWPDHDVRVPGGLVTAVWDPDLEASRAFASTFDIPVVCEKLEDLIDAVDGVMITDDLSLAHQKRARVFVEAKVPTFVDKPLTTDLAEAQEMLSAARGAGGVFMSTSALRYSREVVESGDLIAAAGTPVVSIAACQGQYLGDDNIIHYGIHPLELAYSVFGPGIESAQNIGTGETHVVQLLHRSAGRIILIVDPRITQSFRLTVHGTEGDVRIGADDWDAFYANMLSTFVDGVRRGESPVDLAETLELIEVLIAARRSKEAGGTVVAVGAGLDESA